MDLHSSNNSNSPAEVVGSTITEPEESQTSDSGMEKQMNHYS